MKSSGKKRSSSDADANANYPDADESLGLEPEDEGVSEIEVPFDPTKIDIVVRMMTISNLEHRLENAELDLTPDFQRHANVWNQKRKSRLIESILLRIPLPSFYFSEDEDGRYAVVDGLQRLCAIFHFMRPDELMRATGAKLPPLQLASLQYLKELEGFRYDDLDRKFQRRISELEITANIIRANTPPAVKFNVFARLNQGGMPLNAQEIRNAIFPGVWRNYVRRMAESDIFLRATENKIPVDRQQDIELVLRFVALWQLGVPYERPVNQTLDEFLNSVVQDRLIYWGDGEWKEAAKAFNHAIHAVLAIFGPHAFRKSVAGERRRPINRSLFEAQLMVCGLLTDKEVEKLMRKSSEVARRFSYALYNNRAFAQSLSYATGSASASNIRIEVLAEILDEVASA